MNVPFGGIMLGYFLVVLSFVSSSDNCGPGYSGAALRSLAPCDGGLNFEGCSRTMGLEESCTALGAFPKGLGAFPTRGFLVEAWRMEFLDSPFCQRLLPRGRRNRGIMAEEDMVMCLEGSGIVVVF